MIVRPLLFLKLLKPFQIVESPSWGLPRDAVSSSLASRLVNNLQVFTDWVFKAITNGVVQAQKIARLLSVRRPPVLGHEFPGLFMADIHAHAAKKATRRLAILYSGFRYSALVLPAIVDNLCPPILLCVRSSTIYAEP